MKLTVIRCLVAFVAFLATAVAEDLSTGWQVLRLWKPETFRLIEVPQYQQADLPGADQPWMDWAASRQRAWRLEHPFQTGLPVWLQREVTLPADAASRTYTARLSIVGADDALKLGMSSTVRLDLGAAEAIVVPNTALYTRDNSTRVWLIDRATETVKAVEIRTGESTNDGISVISGLKPGDLVVTAGANLLQLGQKVRLLDAPVAAAVPAVPIARAAVSTAAKESSKP